MAKIPFPNVCRPKPYLFKNDHVYPGTNKTDVPVVILYAEIGTMKFTSFHNSLSKRAEEGTLMYVLRHFIVVSRTASKIVRFLLLHEALAVDIHSLFYRKCLTYLSLFLPLLLQFNYAIKPTPYICVQK